VKKCLDKHSHTAASTWIKTRRQISTWDWFNLQNENVKKGIITFEDFSNFLKGITMSFDDDIFFEYYINNCWTSGNDNTLNNNTNNRYGYDNNNDNVRIRAGKQIMDGL
jgi:hypothetical protein